MSNTEEKVEKGQCVLLLWSSVVEEIFFKETVNTIKKSVGDSGKVAIENIERLILSGHVTSTFDRVLSGFLSPLKTICTDEILCEISRILKPGGKLILREVVSLQADKNLRTAETLGRAIKLAGFINIQQPSRITDKLETKELIEIEYEGEKPKYEIGSAVKLKLKQVNEIQQNIWTLSASEDLDDVDLIDSDLLLNEEDLKKPDPTMLRASCADGEKKKKACKNCTCGLAQEIENEAVKKVADNTSKSACGNCYLGDAFRCSSCPYMGMPAFKPGEKIVLSDTFDVQ